MHYQATSAPSGALGIVAGLFVVLGFATLTFLTNKIPGSFLHEYRSDAFRITAGFNNVADLKVGAPVTIAGVRVGRVVSIALDPTENKAIVTMQIDKRYKEIPDDSTASIESAGILGGEEVTLGPGASTTFLRTGGRIQHTRSALVLENVINTLLADLAQRKR